MSITIINLFKYYGKIEILKGINYRFEDHKKYIIKGENGIGKTTLLKAILNQIKYLGVIEVEGRISYVPEGVILPNYMSIYSFVETISNLTSRVDDFDNLFNKYYKDLGLEVNKKSMLGSLSKGQKQKVNIIQALLSPSEILLLDEPLSGLDPESKKNFVSIIKKDPRMVIIISHQTANFRKKDFNFLEINKGELNVLSKAD